MFRMTAAIIALLGSSALAEPVNLDNFVRAETDTAIRVALERAKLNTFVHTRAAASVDDQIVIRMNRDTLYSMAVLDLENPATVTLPDTDGRYMSLHVINQDHYMFVLTDPGEHVLTADNVGSRYAYLIVRTFADPQDDADIAAANAAQDGLAISGGGAGPFAAPDWDQDQLSAFRSALNDVAKLGMDASYAFGTRDQVKPVYHLVGAASGWGGLPRKAAFYVVGSVADTAGTAHSVTVQDVPVDAFWSISVYNAGGFFEKNDRGAYSFNNITAKANDDGSFTINFGGCDDDRINCLPITAGWNYVARMYQPRAGILDGSWTFPVPEPIQ